LVALDFLDEAYSQAKLLDEEMSLKVARKVRELNSMSHCLWDRRHYL